MTIDQVREAKERLEREGEVPSLNKIVARIGGSKRDVQRFMQQLGGVETVPGAAGWEAEAMTTVAGEELPLPAPPPPEPSPLCLARQARDQTAAQEQALGLEEKALKVQRQALDTRRQQLDIQQQTVHTDAADLERRRQLREVLTQLETVEAERRAVHRARQAAAAAKVAANDAYEALQGQAGRWLRRLRQAQRTATTSALAFERGDALQEAGQALPQLAALVGWEEARYCTTDMSYQPLWLKG
jgi:hypothetical protein